MKLNHTNLLRNSLVAMGAAAAGVGMFAGPATAGPATAEPATAEPATAEPTTTTTNASWYIEQQSWNDSKDKGGVSIYEQAMKEDASQDYVMGMFEAYGEKLTLWDQHPNDRKSIVKLWVGNSGPAVFYSNGDGTKKTFNLSYDEGQTVYLQACTSTSANAVCTDKLAKGKS